MPFTRENSPGKYKAYYIQEHEEYDNIKGPIKTMLTSNTVEYTVREYTIAELLVRNQASNIVTQIEEGLNFNNADSLIADFSLKFPYHFYYREMSEFLNSKKRLKEYNSKKNTE